MGSPRVRRRKISSVYCERGRNGQQSESACVGCGMGSARQDCAVSVDIATHQDQTRRYSILAEARYRDVGQDETTHGDTRDSDATLN